MNSCCWKRIEYISERKKNQKWGCLEKQGVPEYNPCEHEKLPSIIALFWLKEAFL